MTCRHEADSIELEAEEYGWELVVKTTAGNILRIDVHGMASADDLETQLRKALDQINDWKAGA